MTLRNKTLAVLGAFALTAVPVLGISGAAFAASSLDTIITTDDSALNYQETNSAVNPAGTIQALTASSQDSVVLIDTDTHSATPVSDPNTRISYPMGSAFSADGATLYVANYNDDAIAIVDVATATATGYIATPNDENVGISVSPDGSLLVVTGESNTATAFDLTTESPAELWTVDVEADYTEAFSWGEGTVTFVDYSGYIEVLDTSDGSHVGEVIQLFDAEDNNASGYGWCVSPDGSQVAGGANEGSMMYLYDMASGDMVQSVDLFGDGALELVFCTYTGHGQILVSDYDSADPGMMYVLDATDLSLIEAVQLPGLVYSMSVAMMSTCEAFVAGYSSDVAVVSLDSSYCVNPDPIPTPTPTQAALASTGVDASAVNGGAIAAASLVLLGGIAAAAARRRNA